MTLATIDWDSLLTAIWAAAAGGVGVTTAYGFAILGGIRAVDRSRDGRTGAAVVYGAIGALGLLTVFGAIVFGIVILTNK
jgi:hypothetical protein